MQCLLAIAIVVYTSTQLANVSWNYGIVTHSSCIIAKVDVSTISTNSTGLINQGIQGAQNLAASAINSINSTSSSNCLMLEILGGITIGLALLLTILQCCTCNFCGLGGLVDFIFSLAAMAAWIAAAAVVTIAIGSGPYLSTNSINELQGRQTAIKIMTWVETAIFAFIVIMSLFKCCCCHANQKQKDEQFVVQHRVEDVEAGARLPPSYHPPVHQPATKY